MFLAISDKERGNGAVNFIKQQKIEAIKKGLPRLARKEMRKLDLQDADLQGVDLRDADLRDSDLKNYQLDYKVFRKGECNDNYILQI